MNKSKPQTRSEMPSTQRATAEINWSSQVAAAIRPAHLPSSLTPPSSDERVGALRTLSRRELAPGEAVGPLQQVASAPSRGTPRP